MRKIVITGAAGLVGQNLVARLKLRNDLRGRYSCRLNPANIAPGRIAAPADPVIDK